MFQEKIYSAAQFAKDYLDGVRFVIFDVETMQGKGRENQHVVEIGAVEAGKNYSKNSRTFSKILYFDTDNWGQYRYSWSIHKIPKRKILKGGSRKKTTLEFWNYLNEENTAIISHTKVDVRAIKREMRRHKDLEELADHELWNKFYDSKKLAEELFPEIKELGGYGVKNLSKYFGIINTNAHRALADSVATKRIVAKLLKKALMELK